jgi:alpha-1,2-mannosyltransferase
MPWWGISWLNHPQWPRWIGRCLQNADTVGSLLALALLWWALHLRHPGLAEGPGPAEDQAGHAGPVRATGQAAPVDVVT